MRATRSKSTVSKKAGMTKVKGMTSQTPSSLKKENKVTQAMFTARINEFKL